MHSYVLKGILLNGGARTAELDFKCRIFDAIAFQGFIHSSYTVIGVDFGLGHMDFSADEMGGDERTIVRIQVWNINQNPRFIFSGKTFFMSGARFAVAPYIIGEDAIESLVATIRSVRENAHGEVSFGLITMGTGQDEGKDKLHELVGSLETSVRLPITLATSLEEFMAGLVLAGIKGEEGVFILDIGDVPQEPLARATNVIDPFNSPVCLASDNLFEYLSENGLHPNEAGQAILNTADKNFIYKIDLHNMKLLVASRECESCKQYPCHDAFTRICVVLDSTDKHGYASKATGFTCEDTFILSIIYSVLNDCIPASVSSQFPRKRPCK